MAETAAAAPPPAEYAAPPPYVAQQPGYAPPNQAYPPPPPGQAYPPPPGQGYPPPQPQPGYYPPPQPQPPPPPPQQQQQQQQTTVILGQPTAVAGPMHFGEAPVTMTCPSCKQHVVTSISYEIGTLTYVAALVICLIGCDAGCCLIPFCVSAAKDVTHTCPNCRTFLGRYNRM